MRFIAGTLNFFGVLTIIMGIILALYEAYVFDLMGATDAPVFNMLLYIGGGLFVGFILFGFANIIKSLDKIAKKD